MWFYLSNLSIQFNDFWEEKFWEQIFFVQRIMQRKKYGDIRFGTFLKIYHFTVS